MRLSQLTAEDVARLNVVLGSAPNLAAGEILKFSDAVLARAEVNKNADGIDSVGLQELAATLPLMALDDEHVPDKVIGFFVNAQIVQDTLLTDGIIYAARFPEVTQDIVAGRKHLSVEAYGATARCSVCNEVFAAPRDYCSHLADRPRSGAVRWLSGLRAIGGGAVRRNAGTATTFDRNGFVLLASLAEDVSPVLAAEETNVDVAPVSVGAPVSAAANKGESGMDELAKTLAETQAQLKQREAALAQRDTALAAAEERLNALTATHAAELAAMQSTYARQAAMVAAGFSEKAVNALTAKLAAVDADVFDLLLATRRTADVATPGGAVELTVEKQPHAVMAGTRPVDTDPFAVFGSVTTRGRLSDG